jgi:hypothetical protein
VCAAKKDKIFLTRSMETGKEKQETGKTGNRKN